MNKVMISRKPPTSRTGAKSHFNHGCGGFGAPVDLLCLQDFSSSILELSQKLAFQLFPQSSY
uniref:Uncharacterized protein n=1 Tax=Nelumbo nucifera TaxID=4432 RepID=A0A822YI46_NELNU|nr:TPA_asm: hypothetical protein HUJ06_010002 [Nelumbo nucifera]